MVTVARRLPVWVALSLLGLAWASFRPQQAAAQAVDATVGQACQQALAAAEKLRKEAKLEEAVGVCEGFFRQHPDCGAIGRSLTYFIDGVFWRDVKDPQQIQKIVLRGYQEFANVPDYFTLCARYLSQSYLWVDAPKALAVAKEALEKLGDKLPSDYMGSNLLLFHVYSLRNANQFKEAIAAAREYAQRSPFLLSHPDFLTPLFDSVKAGGKPEEIVGVAKLVYVLCDFTQEAISKATSLCSQALTATEGPGVAIQFAKSQEDPKVTNPIKDAPLFNLGEGEKPAGSVAERMLTAAGKDPDMRLNALLYLGRIREALEFSKGQMRASQDPASLAVALKNLARCFKAKDLNLIRANRFLEFHRTGEGENPLKELEAELEKEAKEGAAQ